MKFATANRPIIANAGPKSWCGFGFSGLLHGAVILVLAMILLPSDSSQQIVLLNLSVGESVEPIEMNIHRVQPSIAAPDTLTVAAESMLSGIKPIEVSEPTTLPGIDDTHAVVSVESMLSMEALPLATKPKTESSASFFGTLAYGNRFVYILDASPSMSARQGQRYQRACDELMQSLSRLNDEQSFYLIRFSWDTQLLFDHTLTQMALVPATIDNIDRTRAWLYSQPLHASGTDPRIALDLAQRLDPDAVFLLSDGEFNEPPGWAPRFPTRVHGAESVPTVVRELFQSLPLNCIAFEVKACERVMRQMASLTGGTTRFVPVESLTSKAELVHKI